MSALEQVQHEVSAHMDAIVKLFKPGVKIAVIVRTPGYPERDFMMTDDDLSALAVVIERRQAAAKAEKAKRP